MDKNERTRCSSGWRVVIVDFERRSGPVKSPSSRVSIDRASDLEYDIQSDWHGLRSSVSELSRYLSEPPRSPQADMSWLIDRDDVAVDVG
ncbi:hypothetical protein B296_00031224 [Ensete ventricosum]|uniref:Uncharacterized protein n=1 Tax=Ensete ventricosum TaxID=4639 RepID=A0A427A1Z9_ENSVE|nr:hypothetical protein B296_00031224 [Ensete ventricosum]